MSDKIENTIIFNFRSNSTYLDTEPKPSAPRANISMSSLGLLNPSTMGKNLRPVGQNQRLTETNLRPPLGQNQSSLGQQQEDHRAAALGPKPIPVPVGVSLNPMATAASNPALQGSPNPATNPLLQRLNPQASGMNPAVLGLLDPGKPFNRKILP